jgi:toxin YoeB
MRMSNRAKATKKLHKNLCKILKETLRGDSKEGLGKPEPLKHILSDL